MSKTTLHEINNLYKKLNVSPNNSLQSDAIKSTLDCTMPSAYKDYKFSMSNNTCKDKNKQDYLR